jgi:hypothetical protein
MTATDVAGAANVPAAAAVGAPGESVSRNERAAQHEGNRDGNGCFAKHVLVSLLNMAGAVAIRTLFVDDHLAAVAVWFFTFKSLRPPMVF